MADQDESTTTTTTHSDNDGNQTGTSESTTTTDSDPLEDVASAGLNSLTGGAAGEPLISDEK